MDVVFALFVYTLVFLFVLISVFLTKRASPDIKILDSFHGIFYRMIPKFLYDCVGNSLESCLYTRNPILQCLYLVLLAVGYISYFLTTYQYVSESAIGNLPFMLLSMNLVLFYVCSTSDPGVVTQANVDKFVSYFAYNGVLYKDNRECSTCLQIKPGRSKHCAVCNVCVSRFDHHCGWVNNCIGQHNYKFFLLFILSLVMMTLISGGMTLLVFISIVQERKLHASVYVDSDGKRYKADFSTVVTFLLAEYPMMGFLLLYLSLLFFALACFFIFHLFLVITNRTTNEVLRSNSHEHTEDEDSNDTKEDNTLKSNKNIKRRKRSSKNEKQPFIVQEPKSSKKSRGNFIFGAHSKGVLGNILEVLLG